MRLRNHHRHPVDAVLHVQWCSHVEPSEPRGPCTIVYTLEMPGAEPVSAQRIFDLATAHWPQPGQALPVTVDPQQPSRIQFVQT
jgi:hypothetical protein